MLSAAVVIGALRINCFIVSLGININIYTQTDNGIRLLCISTYDRVGRMNRSYCFSLYKFLAWLTVTNDKYFVNVSKVILWYSFCLKNLNPCKVCRCLFYFTLCQQIWLDVQLNQVGYYISRGVVKVKYLVIIMSPPTYGEGDILILVWIPLSSASTSVLVSTGVTLSCLLNSLWTSGWILNKFLWISVNFNWVITKNWVDFVDLELIFKVMAVEKLKIHDGGHLFSLKTLLLVRGLFSPVCHNKRRHSFEICFSWSIMAQSKLLSSYSVNQLSYWHCLGRLSPLSGKPVLLRIVLSVTDNCPSWISGRGRITAQMISWSVSTKFCDWAGIRTWDPWICSQTHYQLCYGAWHGEISKIIPRIIAKYSPLTSLNHLLLYRNKNNYPQNYRQILLLNKSQWFTVI